MRDEELRPREQAFIVEALLSHVVCPQPDCDFDVELEEDKHLGLWFYEGFDPMCPYCARRKVRDGSLPAHAMGRWILHDTGFQHQSRAELHL